MTEDGSEGESGRGGGVVVASIWVGLFWWEENGENPPRWGVTSNGDSRKTDGMQGDIRNIDGG